MLNTIVAFSDCHSTPLPQRLIDIANENKYIFFLGDGLGGLGDLMLSKNLHAVKGNCDAYAFPDEEVVEVGGLRILLTHGHKYHVKTDLTALYLRATELQCSVVFYGHTHFASIEEYRGITFVCPGSIASSPFGSPSYAYAVVHDGKFSAKIVNIC